jgi:hypothetical protein
VAEPDLMRIFARVASGLLVKVTRPPAEKTLGHYPGRTASAARTRAGGCPAVEAQRW